MMATKNTENSSSLESLLLKDEEEMSMGNVLDCDLTKVEYTPSEQLQKMTAYDSTIEVIGYVDSIEASKLVGARNLLLFKFFLSNGAGDRIQVVAWRDEASRCETILKPNIILHIDGAYAKPSLVGNFNKGSINFKLIIQSSTKLNIFGYHSLIENKENTVKELILLKDLGTAQNNCIRVRGFIKTNFAVVVKQTKNMGNDFGCGSITDGKFKIEVRIPKMENILHDLEKGDHVELVGELQMNANPMYILCKSINDVKKIDHERMQLMQLLQGYNVIQKEKKTENYETPQKKIKQN